MLHLPHRRHAEVQWGVPRAGPVLLGGFLSSPRYSRDLDSTPTPGVEGIVYYLARERFSSHKISYFTSEGSSIVPPPSQSEPPSDNESSRSVEGSRKRSESHPELWTGRQAEHGRQVDPSVVSSSNNKCLHDVQYRECSIVSILPWLWVGGNTHGLRGYPEAVEALRQESCHWRTLVFGTWFSKEIFRYVYIQYTYQ